MKYRNKYEYTNDGFSARHVWTCVGRHGALHFHVSDCGEENAKKYGDRYSGGLEVHYRSPPDYMSNNAPSQDKCWLIGCPCWHDGSSLYASEHLIPSWQSAPHDHDRMFGILNREYEERFAVRTDGD